jgi:hypothetical protein
MSEAFIIEAIEPAPDWLKKEWAEQDNKRKANRRVEAERSTMPSATVVPFPASRQRRFTDLKGEHLYRRGDALRAHKRHLKQLGVAKDKIDADVAALAVAIGFSRYRG